MHKLHNNDKQFKKLSFCKNETSFSWPCAYLVSKDVFGIRTSILTSVKRNISITLNMITKLIFSADFGCLYVIIFVVKNFSINKQYCSKSVPYMDTMPVFI